MYKTRQKSDSDMPQQQGAMRRYFGPSWLEVSGFGVQPQQANFKCVPTLELLAICGKA